MEEVKYAKDYLEEVTETKWNPAQQIGLIPFCCGIGKTTAARKGYITDFVARITNQEISKNVTLLLTFRTLAKQQQLRQGGFVDMNKQSAFGDCVYIGTAQALGNALCNPESSKNQFPSSWISAHPRILILDEIHCLMEGDFALNLNGALEYIEDCAQDPSSAVIALDATTDFLTNYLFGNRSNVELCNILDEVIEPSYAPKKINVISHTSLGTILDLKADKINSSCKAFVVCHSADKAYQLYRKRNDRYQDASFLCSPNSKALIKVAEGEEKEARLLLDQECLKSIVNDAAFPQGVNVVFATIAAREAIELKDSSIGYVALDLYDEIGIIQSMNRVRHSIEELDIIADGRGIMLGLEELERNLEDLSSLPIEPSQEDLEEYYREWLDLQNRCNANEIGQEEVISPIVYKENNVYKINRLALAGAEYRTEAANKAFTANREEFQDYYL